MTDNQIKLACGVGLILLWASSIVAKAYNSALDTTVFNQTLIGLLSGLTGYHIGTSGARP